MRIGFDAKRAYANTSGLGNYARSLLRSLLTYYPDHEYVAFAAGGTAFPDAPAALQRIGPSSVTARLFPALWRSALVSSQIRRMDLSLFHGLSNELPRGLPASVKRIVTVHDLIFLRYQRWYPAADRAVYKQKVQRACADADVVVAVSQQTADDLVSLLHVPAGRIRVVYQSCSMRFSETPAPGAVAALREKYRLPETFLLYVGTIEERKNLLLLARALPELGTLPVVAIGRKTPYYAAVREFLGRQGLEGRMLFPEAVTAEELPLFYRSALALVYPSHFEGFGIPVIEALWSGTPVVAARTSSLPEAGGPHSLYVDPGDASALAAAVQRLRDDAAVRQTMVQEGLRYAAQFHPKTTSAAMMQLYEEITGRT
jgi:glycosyltransferase involved in cell wall biosynthesis